MGTGAAAEFVAGFASSWAAPTVASHSALWADDIVLVQPLMPRAAGRAASEDAFARLFRLIPDLHATVHRWAEADDGVVFVEFTLKGTFGGRPLEWDAVDRFVLRDGLAVERVSYFDAMPVAVEMALRPRGWRRLATAGFRPSVGRLTRR
jgi:ketosteroid isomerase-like protein